MQRLSPPNKASSCQSAKNGSSLFTERCQDPSDRLFAWRPNHWATRGLCQGKLAPWLFVQVPSMQWAITADQSFMVSVGQGLAMLIWTIPKAATERCQDSSGL
mmetsp:Transcript_45730/g.99298  ORF Transcript_45730/g.99298 Transcript_45730/m.99298 type:complete len:103 (+) Transcript_45730:183-491(+)